MPSSHLAQQLSVPPPRPRVYGKLGRHGAADRGRGLPRRLRARGKAALTYVHRDDLEPQEAQ
ncbi:hypothetical protein ACLMAJ_06235 [Nocardia sp. KC 131]|uniref:hypothetical protein n=1 Tax=Nocardia arseniciresistens TaxID=3392119 RepID=UPI00398ED36F